MLELKPLAALRDFTVSVGSERIEQRDRNAEDEDADDDTKDAGEARSVMRSCLWFAGALVYIFIGVDGSQALRRRLEGGV